MAATPAAPSSAAFLPRHAEPIYSRRQRPERAAALRGSLGVRVPRLRTGEQREVVGLTSLVGKPSVRVIAASQDASVREFCMEKFRARQGLKVIAGLHNFDAERVTKVVTAAEKGGATHVDIACDDDLVRLAAAITGLPICVSSIEPEAFVGAVESGAHMVEIGNYDGFYSTGRVFTAEEVLELTRRTRKVLPEVVLSVTVPHTLPLDEQVRLAEALEEEGVDLIQTEGGTSSSPSKPGVHGLIEKAAPTLAAAYSISRAVKVPVLCASGLSVVTAPMAITAGAAGVGIGAAVNKLNDQLEMVATVRGIADSLGLPAIDSSRISRTSSQFATAT